VTGSDIANDMEKDIDGEIELKNTTDREIE